MGTRIVVAVVLQVCFLSQAGASEQWVRTHTHRFSIFKSLFRSQGVTNDHNGHFWYSSASSLLRTNSIFGMARLIRLFPIPPSLHDNHIGDIDYFDKKIFAGTEDGSAYTHPNVVIYDAKTLEAVQHFSLPHDWQPDGVPWVAVDGAHGVVLSSQYSKTTKINVYDLNTLAPKVQIPMSQMIDAIQGAKVFNGSLYMSADKEDGHGHSLYKMGLNDGRVEKLLDFDSNIIEIEGLTIVPTAKGPELDVLAVVPLGGVIAQKLHFLRRVEICSYVLE